jgi:hypothetical protein
MRKFILIAALVLVSATAQAATRGLTIASNEPSAAEQPKVVEAPKAVEALNPIARKSTPATNAGKPKRKRETTEARVVRELHRHGIYW